MQTKKSPGTQETSKKSKDSELSVKVIKPPKAAKEHYVNSKEFEAEITRFYESDIISDELATSITKIANGLSFAPNFINYSYRDDMIGDAVIKMFSALRNKKFRLDSGFSPFSYFTTVAFHAFINRIKKEKKHHDTILEYQQKVYFDLMQTEGQSGVSVYVDQTTDDTD